MVFTPHLQHIASKVSLGEIVILRNYIAQPVSRNDVALICFDVSMTGTSHPIIGDPLDYKVINACNVQRKMSAWKVRHLFQRSQRIFVRNVVEIPAAGHSMVQL